jgi:hypothetical protein
MKKRQRKTVQVSVRLPSELLAALKAQAEREHRSLNGQVVAILSELAG